jgi:hypothetical protein
MRGCPAAAPRDNPFHAGPATNAHQTRRPRDCRLALLGPEQVGSNFPGHPINPPGPSAYDACTIAPNFPSIFDGGKIPEVLQDP